MQIKDVEVLAGITKKNIRFYEKEGLLNPRRNVNNDYREYSEEDVAVLKKIKLLRKLDVPVEEIRLLLNGTRELDTLLRRHARELESRQKNVEEAKTLCDMLAEQGDTMESLDADLYLDRMDRMEREGVTFVDFQEKDRLKRAAGAVAAGGIMLVVILILDGFLIWAMVTSGAPWVMVLLLGGFFTALGISIAASLILRLREIKGGEEYAARKY